jgi:hypothetical protein
MKSKTNFKAEAKKWKEGKIIQKIPASQMFNIESDSIKKQKP